ncbi:putative C-type lectin domain family 20 member A [Clarias gariepinus]|uniref:putative C-type lectin domain family 20 member A n=1 Tax=Clarias gariepinus TaxID=13013 RepID=UPI00234D61D2|nr:putative C-type lectin domain family 20 member A [Clarias gariepinus]
MTPATWPVAQNYCRVMYTDLATILSDTDWLRLKTETKSKGLTTPAWVGLWNDINSWRWSLGDLSLKNVTYTNWFPGCPSNLGGKAGCVYLYSGTLTNWFDDACTNYRPFICYNANFTGSDKFIIITKAALPWLEARAYCRQYHTDLASALNSSDQTILTQMSSIFNPWVGLYRDTWKWSDGTNATDLQWAPGKPNNAGGNYNCAAVSEGFFIDGPCNIPNNFFCHTLYLTKSQTMRLRVESDRSVFDPAVQSLILEQIQQKLDENGMLENITVTWKVQPDGNIFHKKKKNNVIEAEDKICLK